MKPSTLLAIALRDLEACENDSDYKIEMGVWHNGELSKCYVDMSGAVMAKTLLRKPKETLTPSDFPNVWKKRFLAIEKFRAGRIRKALKILGIKASLDTTSVISYEEDKEQFKKDIRKTIKILKENGL
jgi:signal recognition particle subunit SEC65